MIAKFGRTIFIVSTVKTGSAYNPIISENTKAIKAIQKNYKNSEIDGSLIQSDDKRFLIYSTDAISTENKILDDGIKYSIVNVRTVMPGDTNIIYEIQARK